jgi:thioredoxin reductase
MGEVDVVIVGGGPAGLSAALVLGRCRRSVLLFDHGRYRNAGSSAVHGFLTRDGEHPAELRRLAHQELGRYPTLRIVRDEVVRARRIATGFEVEASDGPVVRCRKLVLATGLVDEVPAVPGLRELIGESVFHCAYCDGWEVRDQPLVAYGHGDSGARFALGLTVWSKQVVLCTDESELPGAALRKKLDQHGVELQTKTVERISGDASHVQVHLRDGTSFHARALFYSVGCSVGSDLAQQLGAEVGEDSGVEAGPSEDTSVDGLYVAGDASRDALQAIVAAGEGSKVAVAINKALTREDILGERD